MSSDVPNIPGKRSLPSVKPLRGKGEERGSVPQTPPINSIEFPEDHVQLSAQSRTHASELDALRLTQEDLDRYVATLKNTVGDQSDSQSVESVKADLEAGRYGKEALKATVEGVGLDLGVLL